MAKVVNALELGLSMLGDYSERFLTIKQVNYLVDLYKKDTKDIQPHKAFAHYGTDSNGWQLKLMPNGAGVIKRIEPPKNVQINLFEGCM